MTKKKVYSEDGKLYSCDFFRRYIDAIEENISTINTESSNYTFVMPLIEEINDELYFVNLEKKEFNQDVLTNHKIYRIQIPSFSDEINQKYFKVLIEDIIEENKEKIKEENLVVLLNRC